MNLIFSPYRRTMQPPPPILTHQGDITQTLALSILTMAEGTLDDLKEDRRVKRKVLNVIVELLQNVVKHGEQFPAEVYSPGAIFAIGRETDCYRIMCGNPVYKHKADHLTNALDRINGLDKAGLKALYKEIIKDTATTEKGGAGLGFVDMARKSGEHIGFDFSETSGEYCFFCLRVNVPRTEKQLK